MFKYVLDGGLLEGPQFTAKSGDVQVSSFGFARLYRLYAVLQNGLTGGLRPLPDAAWP